MTSELLTREEKEKALRDGGWHTWYNDNYWVHENLVIDHKARDYTANGVSFDKAWELFTTPGAMTFYAVMTYHVGEVVRRFSEQMEPSDLAEEEDTPA